MSSSAIELEVAGQIVRLSSPSKVLFGDSGYTKLDLAKYWMALGDKGLIGLKNRPTVLHRFPNGVDNEGFFQKRMPKGAPSWVNTSTIKTPAGTRIDEFCPQSPAEIVWAVNQNTIVFHPWPTNKEDNDHPVELRIDLDPSPPLGLEEIKQAALLVKDFLAQRLIECFVKTSGSRGLHLYVPIEPKFTATEVRGAAVALARNLEARHPGHLTDKWWKEQRGQRVFVDFNQNLRDKTVAGIWSPRARTQATVSIPVNWDSSAEVNVENVQIDDFDIKTVPERLEQLSSWDDYGQRPQDISTLIEEFEVDINRGIPDAPWPPHYPLQPFEAPRVAPSRAKKPH